MLGILLIDLFAVEVDLAAGDRLGAAPRGTVGKLESIDLPSLTLGV